MGSLNNDNTKQVSTFHSYVDKMSFMNESVNDVVFSEKLLCNDADFLKIANNNDYELNKNNAMLFVKSLFIDILHKNGLDKNKNFYMEILCDKINELITPGAAVRKNDFTIKLPLNKKSFPIMYDDPDIIISDKLAVEFLFVEGDDSVIPPIRQKIWTMSKSKFAESFIIITINRYKYLKDSKTGIYSSLFFTYPSKNWQSFNVKKKIKIDSATNNKLIIDNKTQFLENFNKNKHLLTLTSNDLNSLMKYIILVFDKMGLKAEIVNYKDKLNEKNKKYFRKDYFIFDKQVILVEDSFILDVVSDNDLSKYIKRIYSYMFDSKQHDYTLLAVNKKITEGTAAIEYTPEFFTDFNIVMKFYGKYGDKKSEYVETSEFDQKALEYLMLSKKYMTMG